jgi:hypothetical protein
VSRPYPTRLKTRKGTIIRTIDEAKVKFCRVCREFRALDQFQVRRNQCRCCTNARILKWKHERRASA